MPRFQYEAKKGPGAVTTGTLEAESRRAAVARLRDLGYYPISIEKYEGDGKQKDLLRHALVRIRLKDRNTFFRQLTNLLESGMPLTRALSTLVRQTANPKLASVIAQLCEDVQKGSSFAEALERHPKLFPDICCSLVRAGESGGALEETLWRIVAFGEQEEELRGRAVAALIYPVFLLVIGSIAIFILMSFVFPKFITIFEDFHAALPWPTRVVMALCGFMGGYWWAVLIGLAAFIAGLILYTRSEAGRKRVDTLVLGLPVIGGVVQKYEMAKFARTLGTLLDNGVPVLAALSITSATVSNAAIMDEVDAARERVADGDSISDSLNQASHFPPMVVSMFAVGEESGRLGGMIKRIADTYDIEVDRAVKAMAALFEPMLIVVMGVIIGFLVIAMLLPMLTLSAQVT